MSEKSGNKNYLEQEKKPKANDSSKKKDQQKQATDNINFFLMIIDKGCDILAGTVKQKLFDLVEILSGKKVDNKYDEDSDNDDSSIESE